MDGRWLVIVGGLGGLALGLVLGGLLAPREPVRAPQMPPATSMTIPVPHYVPMVDLQVVEVEREPVPQSTDCLVMRWTD